MARPWFVFLGAGGSRGASGVWPAWGSLAHQHLLPNHSEEGGQLLGFSKSSSSVPGPRFRTTASTQVDHIPSPTNPVEDQDEVVRAATGGAPSPGAPPADPGASVLRRELDSSSRRSTDIVFSMPSSLLEEQRELVRRSSRRKPDQWFRPPPDGAVPLLKVQLHPAEDGSISQGADGSRADRGSGPGRGPGPPGGGKICRFCKKAIRMLIPRYFHTHFYNQYESFVCACTVDTGIIN